MQSHEMYSNGRDTIFFSVMQSAPLSVAPSWQLHNSLPSERDVHESAVIKLQLSSYLSIVRKSVQTAASSGVQSQAVASLVYSSV